MDTKVLLAVCAAAQQLIQISYATEELLMDTRSAKSPYLQERNDKGRFASDVSIIW